MSVVIAILIGFVLGSLGINPSTGKGYFETPYIAASLGIFSILMFVIGVYRGAYPILSRSLKPKSEMPVGDDSQIEFFDVMDKWRETKEKINRIDERIKDEPSPNRKRLKAKRTRYMKHFNKLELELKVLRQRGVEEKTEAKKLHELITEWKKLKQDFHQCEDRLEITTGKLRERNLKIHDELKEKIDEIEQKISFLREDED